VYEWYYDKKIKFFSEYHEGMGEGAIKLPPFLNSTLDRNAWCSRFDCRTALIEAHVTHEIKHWVRFRAGLDILPTIPQKRNIRFKVVFAPHIHTSFEKKNSENVICIKVVIFKPCNFSP